ncbi:MAG: hypothetical protein H6710_15280 [Myxococcales bacterium]|nr:hypothetical protein [Myxococcales bacterium]MCB9701934.1 hypothetical protein [Myxococcales bacterium]
MSRARWLPVLGLPLAAALACGPEPTEGSASEGSGGSSSGDATSSGGASTDAGTGTGTAGATTGASADATTSATSTGHDTSTGGDATTTSGDETTTGGAELGPRYHEVRQKSAHNAFQRDEALLDQLVYHRIRSLELDIHTDKSFAPKLPGEWYVYHVDILDDASHCRLLSQCLAQIAALAGAFPEHEVVTIWIDLKDGFEDGHAPADLDARLGDAFGDRLLRPAELLAACPAATTLQEAVTLPECGWPSLSALHGRAIAVLTGGDLDDPKGALASYVGGDPDARAAFVAPDLADAAAIGDHPEAIFHNLEASDADLAADVRAAGLVGRIWVLDDADAWAEAEAAGAHHLATDMINAAEDPWASSAGADGWPFTCIDACPGATSAEPGPVAAALVDSDDLWGSSDDALFAHLSPGTDAITLEALIATPSSSAEEWAKACLAARAGVDPAAPYLAVCRPADDQRLRVQLRAAQGEDSDAIEQGPPAGLDDETPAFVRLERDAGGLCARGWGSADGAQWSLIAEHCFDAPLTHVGVAASGHGGPIRLLFVDLEATPGGPVHADDLGVVLLGDAAGEVVAGLGG